MNTSKQLELFNQIEPFIDEGERLLLDYRLRKEIESRLPCFIQNTYNDEVNQRKFMLRLTMDLLGNLPDLISLNDFDGVIAHFPPLKEIKKIGCSENFRRFVTFGDDNRIYDSRMPLGKFLDALGEYLYRDKSMEQKSKK